MTTTEMKLRLTDAGIDVGRCKDTQELRTLYASAWPSGYPA
jgi:hypothetical protein